MKLGLLVVLAACGDSFSAPDAPLFPPDGSDGPFCTTVCSGVCVNLETDPMHCGLCTRACPTDLPSCVQGTCQLTNQTTVALHFGGADFGNAVASVATDSTGNLYATGVLVGTVDLGGGPLTSAGAGDIFVASYTATGAHRWSKVFGGTGADRGAGISLGDRVYLVGNFTGTVDFGTTALTSAGGTDIVEVELDSTSGDVFVARRYGTPGTDVAAGVAWANTNQISIVGTFGQGTLDLGGMTLVGPSGVTGFVATFDLGGNPTWARGLGTTSTATSGIHGVAVDPANNVVVVGAFSEAADFGAGAVAANGGDAFVASYASFGSPIGGPGSLNWAHAFGGPQDDSANAVAIDQAGNVFAGGTYHGNVDFGIGAIASVGTPDGFIVGYTQLGAVQFARHLGAATSSAVNGLAASSTGTVIATGQLEGTADFGTGALAPLGKTDIFVAGFGGVAPTFAKRFGGSDLDSGAAVGAGPGGYFTIGGVFRGAVDLGTGTLPGGASDNGFVMVIAP